MDLAIGCKLICGTTNDQIQRMTINKREAASSNEGLQLTITELTGRKPGPTKARHRTTAVQGGCRSMGRIKPTNLVRLKVQGGDITGVIPIVEAIVATEALWRKIADHISAIRQGVALISPSSELVGTGKRLVEQTKIERLTRGQDGKIAPCYETVPIMQGGSAHRLITHLGVRRQALINKTGPIRCENILLIEVSINHRQTIGRQSIHGIDTARASHTFWLETILIVARVGITVIIPDHGFTIANGTGTGHKQGTTAPFSQVICHIGSRVIFNKIGRSNHANVAGRVSTSTAKNTRI